MLQPSITKVGGISEFKKIAALAQAANLPIAPHSFYFGPGLAATLHVAATFGGPLPVEFPTGEHETPFLARPDPGPRRLVEVPTGPGLGVELNEEAIRRHPYSSRAPPSPSSSGEAPRDSEPRDLQTRDDRASPPGAGLPGAGLLAARSPATPR